MAQETFKLEDLLKNLSAVPGGQITQGELSEAFQRFVADQKAKEDRKPKPVAHDKHEYVVEFFSASGLVIETINREYSPILTTDQADERVKQWAKNHQTTHRDQIKNYQVWRTSHTRI